MKRPDVRLIAGLVAIYALIVLLELLVPRVADDFDKLAVASVGDIFSESLSVYRRLGGRIGSWVWVHFLLFIPHFAASCLLAAVFLALVLLVVMHALGATWKERITWEHPLAAFALLWLCVPSFGQVFFWRTGSYYGLGIMLFLAYLWPYRLLFEKEHSPSPGRFLLLLPVAALAGLSDYNTTIVCAFASLGAALYTRRRGLPTPLSAFIPPLLLLVCFFIIYTAPGNDNRMAPYAAFASLSLVEKFFVYLKMQPGVQAYFIVPYCLLFPGAVVLWRAVAGKRGSEAGMAPLASGRPEESGDKKPATDALGTALFFFLAAQAAQWAFMFVPTPKARAYTSSVAFMVIAAVAVADHALRLAAGYGWERNKLFLRGKRLAITALVVYCLYSQLLALYMFAGTKSYTDACENAARLAEPGSHICVPPGPYRSDRYLFFGLSHQLTDDRDDWRNVLFARHFGLGSIALCAQDFVLVPETAAGTGAFVGLVRQSDAAFTYLPASENKDTPFMLAFPRPSESPLRERVEEMLRDMWTDSVVFKKVLSRGYTLVRPGVRNLGGAFWGSAEIPHVEHTDKGFLVHYKGDKDHITAVIPLRIVRAGEDAAFPSAIAP